MQELSDALSSAISLAVPVLEKTVPWILRKLRKSKIADIRPVHCDEPIKVINSVAYGIYRFEVHNKRRATWHNEYSLPLFTSCRKKARAIVSPPTWGYVDSKGTLILELDNIKREQTTTIIVDVECPLDMSEFITITMEPKVTLSRNDPSCEVEVFNRRDWPVKGVPVIVQAKIPTDYTYNVSRVTSAPPSLTPLPSGTVDLRSSELRRTTEISWFTDLKPREHQKFKVTLQPK